jgi:16S rRNA (uracil1498-N3)-methyltransferase
MRIDRIFVDSPIEVGKPIELPEAQRRHMVTVLRKKMGDRCIIFNGDNHEYNAVIKSITKNAVTLHIEEKLSKDIRSPYFIELAQGMCRGEKMDFVIQKNAELGVNEITPLFMQYSGISLSADRLDNKWRHWQQIADSSCEQSGRTDRLLINKPIAFKNFIAQSFEGLQLLLHPYAEKSFNEIKPTERIQLLIGPEGGISEEELVLAKNYTQINLGKRILRTETAGIVVSSLIQFGWG